MNQRWIVLIAVGLAALAVLLAACGPATPSPVAVSTDTPQAASAPATATSAPAAAAPTVTQGDAATTVAEASPAATEAFPTPNPNPQCTAVPITADPNIKPVAADEWAKGPADASITVIEYGDFQ
jgi:hypothetical protein